ncbi:hypothetical protein BC829DRAFT_492102, partial [Chytridium lagenaria]
MKGSLVWSILIHLLFCIWFTEMVYAAGDWSRRVTLRGAGATFPLEVYRKWNEFYPTVASRRNVFIEPSYSGVGSGADGNITDAEFRRSNGELRLVPILSGAVALVYNLPGLSDSQITLSRESVVGIYNGTITRWNDGLLLRDNVGNMTVVNSLRRVNETINVLVRSDSSGTERGEFFTNVEMWPRYAASYVGTTNLVVGVLRTPNSFGYVDLNVAVKCVQHNDFSNVCRYNASCAKILNKAGTAISPSTNSISAALSDFESNIDILTRDRFFSVVDGPGQFSYPITTFTYFVIRLNNPSKCESAYESQFSPLTEKFQKISIAILGEVACSNNVRLAKRAFDDIYYESVDISAIIFVTGVVVTFGVFVFAFVAIVVFWRYRHKGITKEPSIYSAEQLQLAEEMEEIYPSLQKHRAISFKWSGSAYDYKVLYFVMTVSFDVGLLCLEVFAFMDLPTERRLSHAYLILICIGGGVQFFCLVARSKLISFENSYRNHEVGVSRVLILSEQRPLYTSSPLCDLTHVDMAVVYLQKQIVTEVTEKAVTLVKQLPLIILSC